MAHPMPFDATGDMRPDLLGFASKGTGKKGDLVPKLWTNVWATSNSTTLFELCASSGCSHPTCLTRERSSDPPFDLAGSSCTFPTPHSNAYIDLNGDCLADIFIMCEGKSEEYLSYQIWTNDKAGGYKLAAGKSGDLPRGTKSVGFADMGESGSDSRRHER